MAGKVNPIGAAAGAGLSIAGGLLGDDVDIPDFVPISAQEEQRRAIEGNLDVIPDLRELSSELAALTTSQINESTEDLLPGASKLKDETTAAIESALRGELPQDVLDQISRRASERGFGTGTAGSQFSQFGELRNVGLTSLDRIDKGISAAAQWIAQAQGLAPKIDVSPFLVTATDQITLAQQERDKAFQAALGQNIVSAGNSFRSVAGSVLGANSGQIGDSVSGIFSSFFNRKGTSSGGSAESVDYGGELNI